MNTSWIWGAVTIGGPILLGVVLIWAMLNNRRSRAEVERTERATARLYDEQDLIDKAADHALPSKTRSSPPPTTEANDGPPAENISTLHQAPGDARRPRDTLDR